MLRANFSPGMMQHKPQDDAASQLHAASNRSSRGSPNPREACQGGGERGEEVGRLCWEASGLEAAFQVLLNGLRTAQAVPLSHGH